MIHPTCPRHDGGNGSQLLQDRTVARAEGSTELSRRKARDENFHDSTIDCAI
jgi:hypothetical protein